MASKMTDDYIDNIPEMYEEAQEDADFAFWDEFNYRESLSEHNETGGDTFTITVKNDKTGATKTFNNVHLSKSKKNLH